MGSRLSREIPQNPAGGPEALSERARARQVIHLTALEVR